MNLGPSKCNRQGVYKAAALSITPGLLKLMFRPRPVLFSVEVEMKKDYNYSFPALRFLQIIQIIFVDPKSRFPLLLRRFHNLS